MLTVRVDLHAVGETFRQRRPQAGHDRTTFAGINRQGDQPYQGFGAGELGEHRRLFRDAAVVDEEDRQAVDGELAHRRAGRTAVIVRRDDEARIETHLLEAGRKMPAALAFPSAWNSNLTPPVGVRDKVSCRDSRGHTAALNLR